MKKGILCMLLAAFFFSSMEISIKMTGGVYHPIQLNFLRFLIGGLLLLPLAHRQNRQLPLRLPLREYLFFALTGFVCVVVSMTLFILSLHFASASTVAIIFSSNAFFAILFAALFLHRRISQLTIMALLCCSFGLLLIVNPFQASADTLGIIIGLASAVTFALYSVMVKYNQLKSEYAGLIPSVYTFLFGAAELLLLIGLTHLAPVGHWLTGIGLSDYANIPVFQGITLSGLPLLIYISVFVSGIGYAAHALAIEYASVTIASVTFFVKPVLAPIMAYFLLLEVQPMLAVVGIVIVSIGSTIIVTENLCRANGRPMPALLNRSSWASLMNLIRAH